MKCYLGVSGLGHACISSCRKDNAELVRVQDGWHIPSSEAAIRQTDSLYLLVFLQSFSQGNSSITSSVYSWMEIDR